MITRLCLLLAVSCVELPIRAAGVMGSATEVASSIRHANGNIYDQVLMNGVTATVTNGWSDPTGAARGLTPDKITRVAFVDLNGDIVQVEFGGAGSLTVALAAASGPAPADKYIQPGVAYMKGHAALTIVGSDATTGITIFSVGTATSLNPSIFRAGEQYDGVADLEKLTIVANPGRESGSTFGSIRAGNANFWGASGNVGILAANVQVQEVVVLGDIWAIDAANPVLAFGQFSQFGTVTVAGGDLAQPNGRLIQAGAYPYQLTAVLGTTANGIRLPLKTLRTQLKYDGGAIVTFPIAPGVGDVLRPTG